MTKFIDDRTKITTSSEIDQILKQASAAPEVDDDDHAEIEEFGDERTQIGNVQELAARSMAIEDPMPVPVPRVSTANIIRRPSTPAPVRLSEPMPAVRAQGSLSDVIPPPPADPDDMAFDPWDEPAVEATPRAAASSAPEASEDLAPPAAIAEPPATVVEEPAVVYVPSLAAQAAEQASEQRPMQVRWGAVAWCMLLAVMIGVGTVGYLKISQLERELATAKLELSRAKAR